MTDTEPEIVNGLNRKAILAVKEKMRAELTFGAKSDIKISAVWKNGVVYHTDSDMVSHPPPEIARVVGHPSMNSYCPLVAAGCFSLIYMLEATERGAQIECFKTVQQHDADFSCFYKTKAAGVNPWKDGATLDIQIKGPYSLDVLKTIERFADAHCPSIEIMRREFPVEVTKVIGKHVDVDEKTIHYDMDKYEALSKRSEPIIVKQLAKGRWFCHNECKKYPDALMTFDFRNDGNSILALSHDKPIASGKYANPVQACFFGGLSTYIHTFAVRLYTRGYIIKGIEGTLRTVVNKRMVMGVEDDKYLFPGGAFIELEVESNAPGEVLDEVRHEADEMSPAFMNWRNSIPLKLNVRKVSGICDSISGCFKGNRK